MNDTRLSAEPAQRPWLLRLSDFMFEASMPRLVQDMRNEAPTIYRELISDLKAPLAPEFEREVARKLSYAGHGDLVQAETLMPAMMQRFGIAESSFGPDEAAELKALKAQCSHCPATARCWRAMRAEASQEVCRDFCPNAEAFESKAGEVAPS